MSIEEIEQTIISEIKKSTSIFTLFYRLDTIIEQMKPDIITSLQNIVEKSRMSNESKKKVMQEISELERTYTFSFLSTLGKIIQVLNLYKQ